MPDLRGNTVWVAASFLLSILLAAVLAGVAQLAGASRCEDESQRKPWRAMVTTAMLAGLLAAGIGMAAESVAGRRRRRGARRALLCGGMIFEPGRSTLRCAAAA